MVRMAKTLQFEQLMESAPSEDTNELKKELEELQAEEEALKERLTEVRKSIRGVEAKINEPIKKAVAAARELGLEIPDEHNKVTVRRGNRLAGKYLLRQLSLHQRIKLNSPTLCCTTRPSCCWMNRQSDWMLCPI